MRIASIGAGNFGGAIAPALKGKVAMTGARGPQGVTGKTIVKNLRAQSKPDRYALPEGPA